MVWSENIGIWKSLFGSSLVHIPSSWYFFHDKHLKIGMMKPEKHNWGFSSSFLSPPEVLAKFSTLFSGAQDTREELHKGQYIFPFSVQLPLLLPSSFEGNKLS